MEEIAEGDGEGGKGWFRGGGTDRAIEGQP